MFRTGLAAVASLIALQPAGAVINGQPVPPADPLARMTVMVTTRQGFCSGAVIGQNLVLTAAHCVDSGEPVAVLTFGPGRQPIINEVAARQVHPAYRRADWQNRRTSIDLAVVRTARPIEGTARADLASGGIPQAGAHIRLAGYGPSAESDSRSAGVLRSAALTVTGRPGSFQVRLTGPGGGALGACTGDSGGPVFLTEGGRPVVAGVVSWTTGDGSARCGALTGTVPIAPHRSWIASAVQSLGGTR